MRQDFFTSSVLVHSAQRDASMDRRRGWKDEVKGHSVQQWVTSCRSLHFFHFIQLVETHRETNTLKATRGRSAIQSDGGGGHVLQGAPPQNVWTGVRAPCGFTTLTSCSVGVMRLCVCVCVSPCHTEALRRARVPGALACFCDAIGQSPFSHDLP